MSADDDRVGPAEETFADVLNGFSLTAHRARDEHASAEPAPDPSADRRSWSPDDLPEEAAAVVRAYAWTGGRTRSDVKLAIETLVSTNSRAERMLPTLCTEHQSVARLCRGSKSVAEVGALPRRRAGAALGGGDGSWRAAAHIHSGRLVPCRARHARLRRGTGGLRDDRVGGPGRANIDAAAAGRAGRRMTCP